VIQAKSKPQDWGSAFQQAPGDDMGLDLGGALEDREDAGVA